MGTPFGFLKPEYPAVHEAAIEACVVALGDARISCFYARVAVESSVTWAFEHDRSLPRPYESNLSALLHEPEILFLDETTSGIEQLARRAFWRTITALAQAGVTVIITTHFMEEAEYCDRIAIQDAGKVLALGTPQAVREQAGREGGADMNSAFIAIVERGRSADRGGGKAAGA